MSIKRISKKSLKTPKGQPEPANRRKNNNTKAKRQRTNGQTDKHRSTTHTHKTNDRVTRTPLKTVDELG